MLPNDGVWRGRMVSAGRGRLRAVLVMLGWMVLGLAVGLLLLGALGTLRALATTN